MADASPHRSTSAAATTTSFSPSQTTQTPASASTRSTTRWNASPPQSDSLDTQENPDALFQVISLGLIGPKARQIDGIALGNIGISVKESFWGAGRQGGKS